MNTLYLLLVVILGLLGPSMSVDPRQIVVADVSSIDSTHSEHSLSQDPADHQDSPRGLKGLLLEYEIVYPKSVHSKDPYVEPPEGMKIGSLLSDKFCRNWFDCKPDGKNPLNTTPC